MSFTSIEMYRDGGTIEAVLTDGTRYRLDGRLSSPTRGQIFVIPANSNLTFPMGGDRARLATLAVREAYQLFSAVRREWLKDLYLAMGDEAATLTEKERRPVCADFFADKPYPYLLTGAAAELWPVSEPPYAGDVLEHALNRGIFSAATRYGLPVAKVKGIVEKFADEVTVKDTRCPCEISRADGHMMMCFDCTGPVNRPRILV